MNIGVIGWWHHDNQGDLAMLAALTDALGMRQVVPIDAGFDINADTLHRLNQLDFLIFGGGTQFQSTPPFPFDTFDVWGRDLRTPVGAIGIGIDRIAPQYRLAVTRLVEQAAFFYVRDQQSKRIVDHPKVQVAPDITFLKPVRPARLPDDSGEQQMVCGVNLRRTPGFQPDPWIEALQSLPYTLRGIPFSTCPCFQEMSIMQQLDRTCATGFEQDRYDGLSLMVGTAFHSVVFAVQAAVPVIAIASTPKVRRFMCEVGLEDYVLGPDDWPRLRELADRVLGERGQLCHHLWQISTGLTECARQAMATVRAQINEAPVRQQKVSPRVSLSVVSSSSGEMNRQTIESCLDQTYPNIEVLFIGNDAQVSRQSGCTDARLKVIPTNTESWAMGLNQALAQASGEYLSWIWAGDFYARDAIACMMDRLCADPARDMVFTDFYSIEDRNCILDAHIALVPNRLIRRNVVGPSFLLRRRLCDSVGPLRSDTPLPDYNYWLRANIVGRLNPLHALLFYSQVGRQTIYNRTAERATRRQWYKTRPGPWRAIGPLTDNDVAERLIVRPLLVIRRGMVGFLKRLAREINTVFTSAGHYRHRRMTR